MDNGFLDILKNEAERHGLNLNAETLLLINHFRIVLIDWNKKVNLTRIVENEDFAIKHVIDSLMVLEKIDIKSGASLIDIGTGPGIPGIIIKIFRPDINLTLLESQRKKTDFINHVINELDLNDVRVINDRAETAAQDKVYREQYDVAIARAVSALDVLLELCLPFVKVGGLFVAMKGESCDDEIKASKNALKLLKGKVAAPIKYKLGQDMGRSLIVVSKESPCPKKYPRRPGFPGKNPL